MPDTPHDHGAYAELQVLPLAKPMFSRYFRHSDQLQITNDQLAQLRDVLKHFYNEYSRLQAVIIENKNNLRQEIVTVSDRRATDPWHRVHTIVDDIYDTARELDHIYYQQMEQGFRVLNEEQASLLMNIYEIEELDNPSILRVPRRPSAR